jgi:hypothetical protein
MDDMPIPDVVPDMTGIVSVGTADDAAVIARQLQAEFPRYSFGVKTNSESSHVVFCHGFMPCYSRDKATWLAKGMKVVLILKV